MRIRTLTGSMAAVALLVAACGSDDAESAADPSPDPTDRAASDAHDEHEDEDHDDHDDEGGREEHDEPRPRLAVMDLDAPEVHVIDLVSGETVEVVDLSIESVVTEGVTTTKDGRYLLVGGPDDVNIVDVGTWLEPHGDHAHYYTSAPALVGAVDGPSPTHLISDGDVIAMYFDGSGEAVVIDEGDLPDELTIVETIDTGAAHHGFAVPTGGDYVVTWPHGEEVLMPDHVVVLDDAHDIVSEHECGQTHGEAGIPGGAVTACEEGVLVLLADGDEWDAQMVGYPDVDDADPYGFGGARSWLVEVADGVDWGVAVLGTQHLMTIDFDDATAQAYDVGEPVAIRGVGIHSATGHAATLTHDGRLSLIDLEGDEVLAQTELIEPFPVADPTVAGRSVAVSGDLAWVVDPDANLVIEVDLDDELSEVRRWELDFSPAAVTVHGHR